MKTHALRTTSWRAVHGMQTVVAHRPHHPLTILHKSIFPRKALPE
jgi:hypothetical protein